MIFWKGFSLDARSSWSATDDSILALEKWNNTIQTWRTHNSPKEPTACLPLTAQSAFDMWVEFSKKSLQKWRPEELPNDVWIGEQSAVFSLVTQIFYTIKREKWKRFLIMSSSMIRTRLTYNLGIDNVALCCFRCRHSWPGWWRQVIVSHESPNLGTINSIVLFSSLVIEVSNYGDALVKISVKAVHANWMQYFVK